MAPRFSIVIPTYNRSGLLRFALASAAGQQHDSFEVIVSDDNSTDDTPAVVEEFAAPNVRRIVTPGRMTMAEHFEWASQQTTGEYVMFLCDDDVVARNTLAEVDRAISETGAQVVALNSGVYVFPEWDEGDEQNKLSYTLYSPDLVRCESQSVLRGLFDLAPNFLTPRGNNSFCHRDVMEAVRRKNKKFFLHPAPDMSSCSAVLGVVPFYTLITKPLHVWGVSPESLGAIQAAKGGEARERSKDAFGKKDFFELSPFDVYCPANIWAESMLQVKRISPDEYPELNYLRLYLECRDYLLGIEAKGYDVGEEMSKLEAKRAELGLSPGAAKVTHVLKQKAIASPIGKLLVRLKQSVVPPVVPMREVDKFSVDGRDGGFSNILESVGYFDRYTAAQG